MPGTVSAVSLCGDSDGSVCAKRLLHSVKCEDIRAVCLGAGGGGDGVGVGMEGCKHNLRIACIVQSVLQSLYKTTKTNPYFGAEFTDCIYCGTMKISQYILAEFTICM